MAKVIPTKQFTFEQIEADLIKSCTGYERECEKPLSLTVKYAAQFKWHLTCGILDYIRTLDETGKRQFERDFRYAQLEASLIRLTDHTRRENETIQPNFDQISTKDNN